jgi:AraC-like DNA-binding protein
VEGHLEEMLAVSKLDATRVREWMHRLLSLLDAAVGQLHDQEHAAQGTLLESALVADLCALVQRSEAHFSRSFRRTFGQSPRFVG